MKPALGQRLFAEALGTFLLVATVIGSGIMADRLSADDGVALLGNTLATAAMLVVLILALAPVSGAHFNPVVTFVFACQREIGVVAALLYALAQGAGGALGAIFAHALFDLPLLQASAHMRAGAGVVLSEGAATFALVFAILAVRRSRPDAVAWAVGLTIAAGYWWTASTSFANPAVTLARTLTDTFAGVRFADAPAFIAAQFAGALAGWAACAALFRNVPAMISAPEVNAAFTVPGASIAPDEEVRQTRR